MIPPSPHPVTWRVIYKPIDYVCVRGAIRRRRRDHTYTTPPIALNTFRRRRYESAYRSEPKRARNMLRTKFGSDRYAERQYR